MGEDRLSCLTYAPVIIPTLCRYNHFRACLESLMKCTHADKTDVFIGLDYPLKQSHWEGYEKIRTYIESIKDCHPFKKLVVVEREKNYGFGKNGNARLLIEYVLTQYDRYIFTEDDNILSPGFLDYINKGLTIYENDESIMGIIGYRSYYDYKFDTNTFFKQNVDYLAWGYGIWRDRRVELTDLTSGWFRKQLSIRKLIDFRKTNGNYRCLSWLQFAFSKGIPVCDDMMSVYIGLTGKNVIMPRITLVKNIGIDGSGVHFNKITPDLQKNFDNQSIYDQPIFDYVGTGDEYYNENRKITVESSYKRIEDRDFVIAILKMFFRKCRTVINVFFK